MKIAIVDYGSSNLRSVAKAFEFVAAGRHAIDVTSNALRIAAADRVVFPGQGAIGDCMRSLNALGLVEVLLRAIAARPFLGICLGLQSLMDRSDEDGGTACLGVFRGTVVRFPAPPPEQPLNCKIPHMGWNEVHWTRAHPVTEGIASGSRFYFVHSYYVVPQDDGVVMARCEYLTTFTAAVARDNLFATQFHPEKSQQAGLQLIRNFLAWDP